MKTEQSYTKLEEHKIKRIRDRYKFQEDAIKTIEETKEWGWTEEDFKQYDEIIYCMKNLYKIEGESKKLYMELIRTLIHGKIGWIKEESDPLSVISDTDDAAFYSDMYYAFC